MTGKELKRIFYKNGMKLPTELNTDENLKKLIDNELNPEERMFYSSISEVYLRETDYNILNYYSEQTDKRISNSAAQYKLLVYADLVSKKREDDRKEREESVKRIKIIRSGKQFARLTCIIFTLFYSLSTFQYVSLVHNYNYGEALVSSDSITLTPFINNQENVKEEPEYEFEITWIPEGYEIQNTKHSYKYYQLLTYKFIHKDSSQNITLKIQVFDESRKPQISSQVNPYSKEIKIGKLNCYLSGNNRLHQIIWYDDTRYFTLFSEVSYEILISIVENNQ